MSKKPIVLIDFGGNALIQKGQKGTAEEQLENLRKPMREIVKLSRDYRVVISHGNGPQAGSSPAAAGELPGSSAHAA